MVLSFGGHPACAAQSEQPGKTPAAKQTAPERQPTPEAELRKLIESADNDRAALVRNLESYLRKYPDSAQRPQIYRALVEATLQLRENAKAADYAERVIALTPEDMSMTLMAIQLLERNGEEAGMRRAVSYATRVLDFVSRNSEEEKSPKVSAEEWLAGKKRDRATILALRGRLAMKLHDNAVAQRDFEASYATLPTASAAEQLGEIAELNQQLDQAILQYTRAFSLADTNEGSSGRRELRQKLGNAWRLAHGSEDALGNYILQTYDELALAAAPKIAKNNNVKEPYDFVVRKAPEGTSYPLASSKGKILVLSFWATWCGPCRAMEPHFARVAASFANNHDTIFLAANCDEDESLVSPYLAEDKPRTDVVFSDGLDRLLAVESFPTIVVLDRTGKIAYRAEGFDADTAEKNLTEAVRSALSTASARE